ncbi:MAG: hypothetical protein AUJ12_01050 [Alphaproteobacteria bacterium CG1_02_46_17]|nr:MAG: hypothetical protein AUJ12_01050 [Alphaproteobacteria bacterium CG1_02_46_17]
MQGVYLGLGLSPRRARVLEASPYLGFVASRGTANRNAITSQKYANSRGFMYARDNMDFVQLILSSGKAGAGYSGTYTASIEYPEGTFNQVTWSGSPSYEAAAGINFISDMVELVTTIPEGARFWVRIFQSSTQGILYSINKYTPFGDALEYSATPIADKTMGGTMTNMSGGYPAMPVGVIGMTRKPSFLLIGDSKCIAGTTDEGDATGDTGELARSIGGDFAYSNVGLGGDTALAFSTGVSSGNRADLAQYCSHILCNLGVNDIQAGRTLATIGGYLQDIYAMFPDKKIYQTTITPKTASTDSWATEENQSAVTNFPFGATGARYEVNEWIRNNVAGIDGYFEVAGAVETSLNSGVWKVPDYTDDGLHENTRGYLLIKNSGVIDPNSFTR